jgi:hypothetical protein
MLVFGGALFWWSTGLVRRGWTRVGARLAGDAA